MKFLIEDTWNVDGEAEDIINYCKTNNIDYSIMTYEEIYNFSSTTFFEYIYFCSTDLVQYHLKNRLKNIEKTEEINKFVPDTYEKKYMYPINYYDRKIEKIKFGDIDINTTEKIFIKPLDNNKSFDGSVISKDDTYTYELILASSQPPKNEDIVYKSEVVKFISEYRLLIGNGKLYGKGHICGVDGDKEILPISNDLIDKLVNITGDNYRCVDVGLVLKPVLKWIIIEVNPAFSLDDHKLDFNDYISFCIDSALWINNNINNYK